MIILDFLRDNSYNLFVLSLIAEVIVIIVAILQRSVWLLCVPFIVWCVFVFVGVVFVCVYDLLK